jgi:hypothetical protein
MTMTRCKRLNLYKPSVWSIVVSIALAGKIGTRSVCAAQVSKLNVRIQKRLTDTPRVKKGAALKAEFALMAAGETRRSETAGGAAATGRKLRDPFKAPEPPPPSAVKVKKSHIPDVLPPGVRGLLIDQLILEGVVDQQPGNSMIAVVTNKSNRAYFLRENEQVFDGKVTKITPAAVYFRQRYYTENDRAEWRTVEKRLSPGPGGKK